MRKKSLVFLTAVLIGLSFHACSLPDSINRPKTIKIKGSPDYDLLLNVSGINLGGMFMDRLRQELANTGSDLFSVDVWEVNYGQKEQTFLLKLSTTLTNSFNPDTYLNGAGFDLDLFPHIAPIKYPPEGEKDIIIDDIGFHKEEVSIPLPSEITSLAPNFQISKNSLNWEFEIFDLIPPISLPPNTTGFLHALIAEGVFDIKLDFASGGSKIEGVKIEYEITLKQDNDNSIPGKPFDGLSIGLTSFPVELKDRHINRNKLEFTSCKINIKNPDEPASLTLSQDDADNNSLTAMLTINMKIDKLRDVSWDFTGIDPKIDIPPYSLAEPARYVKEIHFEKADDTGSQGIGLKAKFTETISGLSLRIACPEITLDSDKKPIKKDENIIIGNTDTVQLNLNGYKAGVNQQFLQFEAELVLESDKIVIIPELTTGKPLRIEGTVEFFHNWTSAILDMREVIKIADIDDDQFEGAVPDVFKEDPEEPMDLSILKDYFKGITFEGIKTKLYLSGPEGALSDLANLPTLDFSARLLSSPDEPLGGEALYDDEIKLGNHPVTVNIENGYYKSGNLPPGGMDIQKNIMEEILQSAPKDLYFQYNLTMAGDLEVTPDMVNRDSDKNDIINVDVLVLLPLKMKVTDERTHIFFTEYIGEQTDIFGRKNPGEETGFSNIKLPTLHVSLVFPEQFFSSGTIKLFADDAGYDPLFPRGIPLKGRSINISVSGDVLNKIMSLKKEESSLLILNPLVEFSKGDTVIIPRNMGLMAIKLRISGDYTVNVDDLELW